jgi:hypothetical protein
MLRHNAYIANQEMFIVSQESGSNQIQTSNSCTDKSFPQHMRVKIWLCVNK